MRDAAFGRGKVLYSGLRHTSSEHAARHTVKAALLWELRGVKQVYLLSFSEEELCGREPFDEIHGAMAVRALPERGFCEEKCFRWRSLVKQNAAEWQHAGSSAVGEEAEVADAGKAPRQHMLYEAAQELVSGKCHGALLAVMSIVLPAEADLSS